MDNGKDSLCWKGQQTWAPIDERVVGQVGGCWLLIALPSDQGNTQGARVPGAAAPERMVSAKQRLEMANPGRQGRSPVSKKPKERTLLFQYSFHWIKICWVHVLAVLYLSRLSANKLVWTLEQTHEPREMQSSRLLLQKLQAQIHTDKVALNTSSLIRVSRQDSYTVRNLRDRLTGKTHTFLLREYLHGFVQPKNVYGLYLESWSQPCVFTWLKKNRILICEMY